MRTVLWVALWVALFVLLAANAPERPNHHTPQWQKPCQVDNESEDEVCKRWVWPQGV